MTKLKKIIILSLLFLLLTPLVLKSTVKADPIGELETFQQNNADPSGEYSREDSGFGNLEDAGWGLITLGLGGVNAEMSNALNVGRGGLAGTLSTYTAYMISDPPINTQKYIADVASSLGFAKPAYAQAAGVGWTGLQGILPIWKTFRNLSYLGFVIIFVVIGFMIMFRAKINPQTVISIQSALPKIVITLLLVTFSYAIAGLMVDLIYILIYLLVALFESGNLIVQGQNVFPDKFFTSNTFGLGIKFLGTHSFTHAPVDAIFKIIEGMLGPWKFLQHVPVPVGGAAIKLTDFKMLGTLIIGGYLIIVLFKLFISLLMSYIGIITQVVFAPVMLLFNAFPGNNGFVNWLKGLLANILVFPAVALMFLLAAVLMGSENPGVCDEKTNPYCVEKGVGFYQQIENETAWIPPMMSFKSGGGSAAARTSPFLALIGLGIVSATPKIAKEIKKALGVEAGLRGIVGGALGGILTTPGAAMGAAGPLVGMGLQAFQYRGMGQQREATGTLSDSIKGLNDQVAVLGDKLKGIAEK